MLSGDKYLLEQRHQYWLLSRTWRGEGSMPEDFPSAAKDTANHLIEWHTNAYMAKYSQYLRKHTSAPSEEIFTHELQVKSPFE
jgi:hypothetical protein